MHDGVALAAYFALGDVDEAASAARQREGLPTNTQLNSKYPSYVTGANYMFMVGTIRAVQFDAVSTLAVSKRSKDPGR
jgi:hypothetical protein